MLPQQCSEGESPTAMTCRAGPTEPGPAAGQCGEHKHVAPPPAGFQGPRFHSTPSVVCRGMGDVPDGQRGGGLRGHVEVGEPICSGAGAGRPSPPLGAGCWVGSGGCSWPGSRAGCVMSGGHPLCGVLPAQERSRASLVICHVTSICPQLWELLQGPSHGAEQNPRRPGWVLGWGPPSLHRVGVTLL